MMLTAEIIAEAMAAAGMEVQYFPLKPLPTQQRKPYICGSLDKIAAALNAHLMKPPAPLTDQEEFYLRLAREEHHKGGEIEFDADAKVSIGEGNGAYVQAWVWIDGPQLDEADEEIPVDSEGGHCD